MELSYRSIPITLVTFLTVVTFAKSVHTYEQLHTPVEDAEKLVSVETQLFPSGNGDLKILGTPISNFLHLTKHSSD